jgi:hypothetical protein
VLWVCVVTSALAGCAAPTSKKSGKPSQVPVATSQPSAESAPRTGTSSKLTLHDPCSSRLHDICGPLLLYYATHAQLPKSLDELKQVPGFESLTDYTCPVSNKPYVYNPKGVRGPNISQIAVIYDPEPTHNGYRWAIAIEEPAGNAPLQAKVVAWPESRFPKTAPTTP